jgi:hypothetical protein
MTLPHSLATGTAKCWTDSPSNYFDPTCDTPEILFDGPGTIVMLRDKLVPTSTDEALVTESAELENGR